MVHIVSDNSDLLRVKSLKLQLYGLNENENAQILSDRPTDEFLKVSADYRYFLDHEVALSADEQPLLKRYMEGPFLLDIHNIGSELSQSFLVFDLNDLHPENAGSEIVTNNRIDLSHRSLAVYPFVEVFRPIIEEEAKRAERLIKASKTANLSQERASREARLQEQIMSSFRKHLNPDQPTKEYLNGKEAVADVLSGSLEGSKLFYSNLWIELSEFFNDSCRYLGEQYALGKTDLKSPPMIKVEDKGDDLETEAPAP